MSYNEISITISTTGKKETMEKLKSYGENVGVNTKVDDTSKNLTVQNSEPCKKQSVKSAVINADIVLSEEYMENDELYGSHQSRNIFQTSMDSAEQKKDNSDCIDRKNNKTHRSTGMSEENKLNKSEIKHKLSGDGDMGCNIERANVDRADSSGNLCDVHGSNSSNSLSDWNKSSDSLCINKSMDSLNLNGSAIRSHDNSLNLLKSTDSLSLLKSTDSASLNKSVDSLSINKSLDNLNVIENIKKSNDNVSDQRCEWYAEGGCDDIASDSASASIHSKETLTASTCFNISKMKQDSKLLEWKSRTNLSCDIDWDEQNRAIEAEGTHLNVSCDIIEKLSLSNENTNLFSASQSNDSVFNDQEQIESTLINFTTNRNLDNSYLLSNRNTTGDLLPSITRNTGTETTLSTDNSAYCGLSAYRMPSDIIDSSNVVMESFAKPNENVHHIVDEFSSCVHSVSVPPEVAVTPKSCSHNLFSNSTPNSLCMTPNSLTYTCDSLLHTPDSPSSVHSNTYNSSSNTPKSLSPTPNSYYTPKSSYTAQNSCTNTPNSYTHTPDSYSNAQNSYANTPNSCNTPNSHSNTPDSYSNTQNSYSSTVNSCSNTSNSYYNTPNSFTSPGKTFSSNNILFSNIGDVYCSNQHESSLQANSFNTNATYMSAVGSTVGSSALSAGGLTSNLTTNDSITNASNQSTPTTTITATTTSSSKGYDYLLKFLLVGDSDVGKHEILAGLDDGAVESSYCVGSGHKSTVILLDGKRVKLQLWDTSGQGRFCTIIRSYSRGAQGILLVYDITNKWSFEGLDRWMDEIQEHAPGVPKVLIGNRLHLAFKRQVSQSQAEQYAARSRMSLFEVSPLCDFNIVESFTELSRLALRRNGMERIYRANKVLTLQEACCRSIVAATSSVYGLERLPLPPPLRHHLKSYASHNHASRLRQGIPVTDKHKKKHLMIPGDCGGGGFGGGSGGTSCVNGSSCVLS